jgi:PAS domain S-box-containing protein
MKLATKGILLVSVPVVMQVILIVTLSMLLWQAHNLALQEASAKDIIADCNLLTQNAFQLVKHVYGIDGDSTPLSNDDITLLQRNVTELKQKLGAEKDQTAAMEQLTKLSTTFIPLLYAARDHKLESQGSKFRSEKYLFRALDQTYSSIGSVIASVNTMHRNDPEERARAAEAIKYSLIGFVIVSIILTLALAYFASISIRKPLELMAKNAANISKRIALEPAIDGRDELADLDNLLHQVDESIDVALTSERNLISYAGDLVCSIDQHGIFRSANPFASSLLGYHPEDLIGSSVLDVVLSDDCDKVDRLITARNQNGGTTTLEVRMQSSTQLVIETSWSAIWSERDNSLFCVIHDITERKHLERLKQDFIAMISHDLRTPLMSVNSSIDLVQSGATGPLQPQTERQLNSASRSAEHLIDLVNDLLDFEKLEAGRMDFDLTAVSFNEVFDEAVQLVKALSDERQVQIQIPDQTVLVIGDHRKLVQVVVNLLSNALKHSPNNSLIRLESVKVEDLVEISVHDQGPGIPDEYAESIFAPFEQITDRPTAALGTGLGLAICKLIIEGQGGEIGVRRSSLLNGSAFWFTVKAR